jgi:hypothetical protein
MDSTLEGALAQELSARHGVTTRKRLFGMGVTRGVIDTLASNGRLQHLGKGVLVSPSHPETLEQRSGIACAHTGGVVCYPTAGLVWEYRKTPRSRHVHVWIPRERRIEAPEWVTIHRTPSLPRGDIVRRPDGITVTSPPRTAFDAAAVLTHDDLESLIEQGLDRGNFIIPTLWAVARRLCANGRAGSARFVEVLRRREPWLGPVDSDHEIRLERALRRRGFPAFERQPPLEIAPGRIIRRDLGIPEHRFYIEVDHLSWHGGRLEGARDRRRDLKGRARGVHIERVTDIALDRHLDETVEDLWTLWQRILGGSDTPSVLDPPR